MSCEMRSTERLLTKVWRRKRYIKGKRGAPCSLALKRSLLNAVGAPGDIKVIGLTVEEQDRVDDLEAHFPEEFPSFSFPLVERGITHDDCLAIVDKAGILLPLMYRMGYQNANCVGCPKGGQNYWQKIRHDFPARFVQIQTIQEEIGPGANFLRFRSGPRKNERMSLRDLPPGLGNLADEPNFSCGFVCELTLDEVKGAGTLEGAKEF